MSGILTDIGSAIGYAAGAPARGRAGRDLDDAKAGYEGLDPNITAEDSADYFSGVNSDAATKAASMDALKQLQGISDAHGMDPQAQAALQQAQAQSAAQGNAALERANAAGTMNSGRAIGAQLQAQQNSSVAGVQAAADAAERQAKATGAAGMLSQNMNAQDFNQQATKAAGQAQTGEFNAHQDQNAQQETFNNSNVKATGISNADANLANFNMGKSAAIQNVGATIGDSGDQTAQAAASFFGMSGPEDEGSGGGGSKGGSGLGGLMAML